MKKTNLATLSELNGELADRGIGEALSDESIEMLLTLGLRDKSLELGLMASSILLKEQPTTLRGLLYRVVSDGNKVRPLLPTTDQPNYNRLGRLMTRLRETGFVPFHWIVDNIRSTIKPSSWSGIRDFVETVQDAYRLDFWSKLPEYIHIIVEKDAIAGVLAPVTRKYDVALSPIRGYVSLSFAHEIASQWNEIEKPIHDFYLGDFDPSSFDLERDVREKLSRYCDRAFRWQRLGVNQSDFTDFDLLPLPAKTSDRRYQSFLERHGKDCAEIDAIPATELRRRVEVAITSHIPRDDWERLQQLEQLERHQFLEVLGSMI